MFVMGDNRDNSADSRVHLCQRTRPDCAPDPFVPVDDVVGKVFVLLWPHEPVPRAAPPGDLRRRPRTAPRPAAAPADSEPPAPRSHRPARRRPLRLRARAAPGRARRRSPASTRPAAAPAPGRWSPAAAILPEARRGRSPGWPTPSCSPRRPASAATPRSCAGRWPGRWSWSSPTSATGSACTSPTSRRCAGRVARLDVRPRTSSPTGSRSTGSGCPGSRCGRATGSRPASRAASVLAKVTRDRIMVELHERATRRTTSRRTRATSPTAHAAALTEHGPCPSPPDAVRQRARAAAGPLPTRRAGRAADLVEALVEHCETVDGGRGESA